MIQRWSDAFMGQVGLLSVLGPVMPFYRQSPLAIGGSRRSLSNIDLRNVVVGWRIVTSKCESNRTLAVH